MPVKFGPKQVNNPTPRGLSLWFDGAVGFLGIINAWLLTAAYISHSISDVVGSLITGLIIPSLLFFKRFFGQEITTDTVPADQVTEMSGTDNTKT